MEKFDQKKYIEEYNKEHYKQFKAKIKTEDMDEINNFLKKQT